MIAAVDTEGRCYMSILQVNSDSEVFCLFIQKLLAKLTSEDINWRANTVIQIDQASYHKSPYTRAYLQREEVKVLLMASYAYDASVCELFFAAVKRTNINPTYIKTGKR